MKITYVAKNYKIADKFKDIIEKKLAKFERYFSKNYDVKVACIEQNDKCKLEITVNADGLFVRSEVWGDNMYNNIDLAMPKLERQIVKGADKYNNKFKRNDTDKYEYLTELPVEKATRLVKTKRFELEPITVEDAEAYMEALGHNFYVFLNAQTGLVSIVYKRADGNIGMIEITY